MSNFDPYHQWLAIPKNEQPPNHYRLLGVTLFESDADVIAASADRQMAHVRTYQHGPHSQLSQRLLNEISAARLTLLIPESKAKYDEHLHRQMGATAKPAVRVARPLPGAQPAARPAAAPAAKPAPAPHRAPAPAPAPARASGVVAHDPVQVVTQAKGENGQAGDKPAPSDRARQKQTALYWMIGGVIGGGITGTYLAGLVLNLLGAPIPTAARFLPGLGAPKTEAVAKNEGGGTVPITPTGKSKKRGGADASSDFGSVGPAPGWQPVPGNVDPWDGYIAHGSGVMPGDHVISYLESNGRGWMHHDRMYNNLRQADGSTIGGREAGRSSLFSAMLRSPSVQHGYDNQLRAHYYFAPPGAKGVLAFPITCAPGSKLTGSGNVELLFSSQGAKPEDRVDIVIARKFDRQKIEPTSGTYLFTRQLPGGFSRSVAEPKLHPLSFDFPTQEVEELFVVVIFSSSANSSPGAVRMLLANHDNTPKPTFRVQVAPKPADLASTGNPPVNPSVNIGGTPESDPGDLSRVSSDLQEAVQLGDVLLASAICDRMRSTYSGDFVAEQTKILTQLYQARKPAFQPVAFAAWSVDLFQEAQGQGKLDSCRSLLTMALAAARESGDADVLRDVAHWAVQFGN